MLVITRCKDESFFVNGNIKVTILGTGTKTRIGIEAPEEVSIVREELLSETINHPPAFCEDCGTPVSIPMESGRAHEHQKPCASDSIQRQ